MTFVKTQRKSSFPERGHVNIWIYTWAVSIQENQHFPIKKISYMYLEFVLDEAEMWLNEHIDIWFTYKVNGSIFTLVRDCNQS